MPSTARERRLTRHAAGGARTSLLTAASAAGLAAAGFDAVGDVMGGNASILSRAYAGGCGFAGSATPTVRLGGNRWSGYASYLKALRAGYETTLRRLRDEAVALGADGVVGVDVHVTRPVYDVHEFIALGTAVRARSTARPSRPFLTDLGPDDVAKLLLAGWVPVGLHYAIEIGMRHDDIVTLRQAGRVPGGRYDNAEVAGYTELITAVKASVRAKLRGTLSASGADGGLLRSLRVRHWHTGCGTGGSDHVMEAVASGTSLARFASVSTSALPVVPLATGRGR